MPKSESPRQPRALKRLLDWGGSYANLKRFFDTFDYEAFNARCRAEGREEDQIHYRRANIRSAAQTLFRLVMDGVRKKVRPGEAIHFSTRTFRTSLATLLDRTTRSIDRYLDALQEMLFITERKRTGRALVLVLAANLFVYLDAGEPRHVPPVPGTAAPTEVATTAAAEDDGAAVELDPQMREAIERAERKANILAAQRAKNGESSAHGPLRPPS